MSNHTDTARVRRAKWQHRIGKPANHYWSTSEHSLAVEMRQRGRTYGQIALRVRRTPDAVAAHLRAATR